MKNFSPHRFHPSHPFFWAFLALLVCSCVKKTGFEAGYNQIELFRYAKFEQLQLPSDVPKYTVEDRRSSPRVMHDIDVRMSMTPSDYLRAGLDLVFAGAVGLGQDDARELRFGIKEFRLDLDKGRYPYELTSRLEVAVEFLAAGQVVYRSVAKAQEVDGFIYPMMQGRYLERAQETLDQSFYKLLKKVFYDPALVAAIKQQPRVAAQAQPVEASPPVAQPLPVAPPPSAIVEKPKPDEHVDDVAVIIGNKDYLASNHKVPDVTYALNDAERMRRFVIETLGYREGNVILVKNATQASLVSLFGNEKTPRGKLASWLKPNRSRIFVYYSGHGAPSLTDGQGYLLPVDADPNTIELNGYALELLYRNLGQLPALQVTVVLDACFSGSSQAGMVISNASPAILKVVDTKAVLPNATVITAAGVSEVASWDEEARLGLFTRQFLEAAGGKADGDGSGNGDGKVTVAELRSYLNAEVPYLARRLYMREQHPQVVGRDDQVIARVR